MHTTLLITLLSVLLLCIIFFLVIFFFNDLATTEIYTLSLHDALPIYGLRQGRGMDLCLAECKAPLERCQIHFCKRHLLQWRSEEHTSELQSHSDLVCRLLLEKKKKKKHTRIRFSDDIKHIIFKSTKMR